MKILIAIPIIAVFIVLACACLAGFADKRMNGWVAKPVARFRNPQSRISQSLLTSSPTVHFLHRHDSFQPTSGNLLLLGFAAGAAVVTIVFTVCIYFTR